MEVVLPSAQHRHLEVKENGKLKTNRFALILHTLNSKQHSALADDGGCDDGGDVAASSRNS